MHSMSEMLNLQGKVNFYEDFDNFIIFWCNQSDQLHFVTISGATDWQPTISSRSPSQCPESSQHSFRFNLLQYVCTKLALAAKFDRYPKKIWILEKVKFQDDLFPPTRVLWRSSCSGARWLAGELGAALWVNKRRVTKTIFLEIFWTITGCNT